MGSRNIQELQPLDLCHFLFLKCGFIELYWHNNKKLGPPEKGITALYSCGGWKGLIHYFIQVVFPPLDSKMGFRTWPYFFYFDHEFNG